MLNKEGQRVSSPCIKFRKYRGNFSSLEISKIGEGQPCGFISDLFLVFSGLEVYALKSVQSQRNALVAHL